MSDLERRSWAIDDHFALQRLAENTTLIKGMAEEHLSPDGYSSRNAPGPYEYTPDFGRLGQGIDEVASGVEATADRLDLVADKLESVDRKLAAINRNSQALGRMELQLEEGLSAQKWNVGSNIVTAVASVIGHIATVNRLTHILGSVEGHRLASIDGFNRLTKANGRGFAALQRSMDLRRFEAFEVAVRASRQRADMLDLQEAAVHGLDRLEETVATEALYASDQRESMLWLQEEANRGLIRLGDVAIADALHASGQRAAMLDLQGATVDGLGRLEEAVVIEGLHASGQRNAMLDLQGGTLQSLMFIEQILAGGLDRVVFTMQETGQMAMRLIAEGTQAVEVLLRQMERQRHEELAIQEVWLRRAEEQAQKRHEELISLMRRPNATQADERYEFAKHQYAAGNIKKALQEAAKALDHMSTHMPCLVLAGRIAEDHAVWAVAKDYYFTALQLAQMNRELPYFREAIVRLVQIEWRLGNEQAALDALIEARTAWGAEHYPDELLLLEYELDKTRSLMTLRDLWWTCFYTEIDGHEVKFPIPVQDQEGPFAELFQRYLSGAIDQRRVRVPLEAARKNMGAILEKAYEVYFDIIDCIDQMSEMETSNVHYKRNAIRIGGYLPLLQRIEEAVEALVVKPEAGLDNLERVVDEVQEELDRRHSHICDEEGVSYEWAKSPFGEGSWPQVADGAFFMGDGYAGQERVCAALDGSLDQDLEALREEGVRFAEVLYGLRFATGPYAEDLIGVPLPRFCFGELPVGASPEEIELARYEHRVFYRHIFPEKAAEPIAVDLGEEKEAFVDAAQRLYALAFWILLINESLEDPKLSPWYKMYMRDGFEKILEYEGKIYRLVQTLSEQEGVDLVLMDQFIEAVNSLSDTVETELVDFENVSPLGRLVCGSVNDKEGAINGFMQRMSQEWPHLISGRLAMPGSDKEPSLSVSNQEDAENMEPLYAERCKQKARRSRRVETNLWMKELDELC